MNIPCQIWFKHHLLREINLPIIPNVGDLLEFYFPEEDYQLSSLDPDADYKVVKRSIVYRCDLKKTDSIILYIERMPNDDKVPE